MKVIGITGTNGKSTVVDLTTTILEKAGYKTGSISSIRFKIGDKQWKNMLKMTMPGRLKLQKFIKQANDAGCEYLVLEVTSEGIKQFRHRFIDFNIAVFTNLAPEHIESHGGFEKYKKAKGELFKAAKNIHIVNLDDENSEFFLSFSADKKIGYRIKSDSENNKQAAKPKILGINVLEANDCRVLPNGISFSVNKKKFNLDLLGKFNIYNSLTSISIALSLGIDLETCVKALSCVKGIEGRMEIVVKKPFTVVVDYAHTPDALKKVYKTFSGILNSQSLFSDQAPAAKFETRSSKMICVFGAVGGIRDKWKRQEFGKIAVQYCDEIILTNEDPYDEDPIKILDEIEKGISANQNKTICVQKILDRRKAIEKGLEIAKQEDVVIITGKGCEPWMCVANNKKIPWDDRQIVRDGFKHI